jgi:hypothetical protein
LKSSELKVGDIKEEDFVFMPSTHGLASKIRGMPKITLDVKAKGANKNVN